MAGGSLPPDSRFLAQGICYIETLDHDETRLEELGTRRQDLQATITQMTRRFAEMARDMRTEASHRR